MSTHVRECRGSRLKSLCLFSLLAGSFWAELDFFADVTETFIAPKEIFCLLKIYRF